MRLTPPKNMNAFKWRERGWKFGGFLIYMFWPCMTVLGLYVVYLIILALQKYIGG